MEPTLAMEAEDIQLQNTVIMAYAAQPLGETESRHGFGEIGEQRDGIKSPPAEFSPVFDDSTHSLVDPATTTADSESPKQDIMPVMPAGEPEPRSGSANPLQPPASNQFVGEAQPGSRSPSKQAAGEHSATKIDGDNVSAHQLPAGEAEKVLSSHTISHPESNDETAITYEVSEHTGVVVERGKPRTRRQSVTYEVSEHTGVVVVRGMPHTPRPDSLFSSTDNTDMDEVSEPHDSDTVDQLSAYDTKAGTDSNIFIKLIDTSGMKGDLEIDEVDEAIPANAEDVTYMVSEDTGVVVERARRVSITSRVPAVHMGSEMEQEIESAELAAQKRRETLEKLIDETDALQKDISQLEKTGKVDKAEKKGRPGARGPAATAAQQKKDKKFMRAQAAAEAAEAAAAEAEAAAAGPPAEELRDVDGPMKKYMYGWAQPFKHAEHREQAPKKVSLPTSKPLGITRPAKPGVFRKPVLGATKSSGAVMSKGRGVSAPTRPRPAPAPLKRLSGQSVEEEQDKGSVARSIYGWALRGASSAGAAQPLKPTRAPGRRANNNNIIDDDDDEETRRAKCRVKPEKMKFRRPKDPGCLFKSCAPIKPLPNFREKPDSCLPVRK